MATVIHPGPDRSASAADDTTPAAVAVGAPAGLRGLVVADTSVGDVRAAEGFFHYRGHSAVELARIRTFEDVWFLLDRRRLPDAEEHRRVVAELGRHRVLPGDLLDALPALAAATPDPVAALGSALALAGSAVGARPLLDLGPEARRAQATRLVALVPSIVAALHRLRRGQAPVPADPSLGHAADYLRMLTASTPDQATARALDRYLVLTADHGFNASTFTARVVASTGADLAACVVAALAALSGPLHGGAPSRALDLLDAIAAAERAEAVVEDLVGRGERIMGFGHAVYEGEDPRSALLRDVALDLGGPRAESAVDAEETVIRTLARLKPDRDLRTNVEFYAGVVMERCGVPAELFTSTFAVSRSAGWLAHALEQALERRLIRPSARYVGPPAPVPVPGLDAGA